ncbi:hypothetical protein SUGI_0615470 [Cryptomeria japonica]|uniref:6-phosphofructo-2-kinase/fructose-2, 6-bisphosphatase isoform X2 n=1 Tax=Cryptomeria japonica TaxID=3369 RepID=UPI002414C612|nr:6-phosphofructo-2-kinase/fructose-2,6-bisphosphatase isoform X2 [Cryptomeria japonica]GLJ30913.1 hypothetical protein SUGI_0615470 [Cryptomeria japonica]
MGAGGSKAWEKSGAGGEGEGEEDMQLYVSLNMEWSGDRDRDRDQPLLIPHVYGSLPLVGSWDPSKALALERESTFRWEISFVAPPNHGTLDFKFLLKPKHSGSPCIIEEGINRLLTGGALHGDAQSAFFRLPENNEMLEYLVYIKADKVSPFDLAASWRAYQKILQPSTVRRVPDISIDSIPVTGLEDTDVPLSYSHNAHLSELAEYKSVGTDSSAVRHTSQGGLLVDRGVGSSPKTVQSNAMPEAAGAVAAAAVADRMLGPKEHQQMAIVLVGLPARGKTFTAAKLTRYLRWLGHDTKHFNVGKYRRLKHGLNQTADFFRADNQDGVDARNEVAALAMEDMLSWMLEGGQVGIFDATNSTRKRRNMLMQMAEGKCKIIFLETICNDQAVIEQNICLKIRQSPDYANQPDLAAGMEDFKNRLSHYEKVYEPVEEGSYIKMIDTVSGKGGQMQINNISGYLPGRIVFFLVNTHLTPRPILLTRHGESRDNVRGRIGGDSVLSEAGEEYAMKLADFVNKRLRYEKTACIWTSTLQRTILTAQHIGEFPKIQWRALDEINAGVCDGMTYEEIKKNTPEEYDARKADKLRYRYPRGESYLDVIQRLEPVIIELERQRAPVVVIAHQAVLRALYAYFADKPLKEVPHIEVPLHSMIEIQMEVTGVHEKIYKLVN